jgi:5-methylcytosine-specific restriction endonuclease McrA
MLNGPSQFQGLLFGDDVEAQAQEVARLAALEAQKAHALARKIAWAKDKPFPEDEAKWYAAQMVILQAFYLVPFWDRREPEPYCPSPSSILKGLISALESNACSRANRLHCKVGRRGPLRAVYKRAVRSPVLLCYWCKKLTRPQERHVDHKQPLAVGGEHVAGNLCIACVECNLVKGDTDPNKFRQTVAGKRMANSLIAADYFRWLLNVVP